MIRFSYSTEPRGYQLVTDEFDAGSFAAAQKRVWEKLAIKLTSPHRKGEPMSSRVQRAKDIVGYPASIRLVNESTGEDWSWEGGDAGWVSYEQLYRDQEARVAEQKEAEKRGYIERDGVRLSPVPLQLEKVTDASGDAPVGSSGYGYLSGVDDGVAYISDAVHTGRRWPAVWDYKKRQWIVVDVGEQWTEGRVTERFLFRGKAGTKRALERRHGGRAALTVLGSVRGA